ncbi:hypothetical protein PR048_019774 [Dryococelus australis]|uniref:Uncharacterized protein n=1 Tax=Dryococelus australis TaxID=614101 RepID=A0ABQ9H4E7_9NEOP|nr:hypothetical protein PR048_019774 [Dryococelus australis]
MCGAHSFATVSQRVTFFGTLENLYCFFSVSTYRWRTLVANVVVTVKILSDTIWINYTQKYLQKVEISFEACVIKMRNLKIFLLKDKRSDIL